MPTFKSPEDQAFAELSKLIEKKSKKVRLSRIKRAYQFAKKAHDGQFRMSGDPYIVHPVATAKTLVNLGVDEDTIITGLLHDVPEDTDYSVKDIETRFGKQVARLVSALTKLSKVYYKHSMGDRQIQSLRKMFVETAKDPRVVIVKLADRLHNMSTLKYLRADKQQRIAKETLEIYAPLANLYGIYQLRRQLEDLCFMYLQPEEYQRIEAFVQDHERKRTRFVNDSIKILNRELKKAGLSCKIMGRPKHFYSIYQKMLRDQKVLKEIFDYFALRIITKTPEDCYHALGIVHEVFKPKPGRFKDYIALPKVNGYRSLHTTVVGLEGKLTEIQIRTQEMHHEAEFGAAAHMTYKKEQPNYLMDSLSQLKKYKQPEHFIQSLQDDILQKRIYVFSPNGNIVNLPEGATCLDYVYAVKLPVDTYVFHALVNGKPYSLRGVLQSGDHIQIVYTKRPQKGPERWWLEHVKTARARKRIQEYFHKKSLADKVRIGERLLQKELDHENQGLIYQLSSKQLLRTAEVFNAKNFEEILAKIGEGSLESNEVYKAMFPEIEINAWTRLWKWIKNLQKNEPHQNDYYIRIVVESYDRTGLLRDILKPFYEMQLNIERARCFLRKARKNEPAPKSDVTTTFPLNTKVVSRDIFDVYIRDHEQLIMLFDRIEKVPGVIRVQRAFRHQQARFWTVFGVTVAFVIFHPMLLQALLRTQLYGIDVLFNLVIYTGLLGVLGLMWLLKSISYRTFPHFEETKYFWPLLFGLTLLALVTLFVDDAIFDLGLSRPVNITLSIVILGVLYRSYRASELQRTRHLKELRKKPRANRTS